MRAILSPLFALTLVACGGSPAPAPDDGAALHPTLAPAPTSAAPVMPTPSALKTFDDWAVGCDNGGTCQASSLMDEDAPAPPVLMALERAAGPDGAIVVRFQQEGTPPLPLTLLVDDEAVVRGGTTTGEFVTLTGAPAATLAGRIANGRTLTIQGGDGRAIGSLSLTGAAAALRWIDAEQGRAGTTGAIVAKGERPDTRPAPAVPVVRVAATSGEAALLDPQLVATMRKTAGCTDSDLPETMTKPLGGGRTLALVPCLTGAYNLVSAVFVVERGKATPAAFDTSGGIDGATFDLSPDVRFVVNGDFADGVLSNDAKGRGLGDCGTRQRFAWDGARFRLIEQRDMTECRGSIDFIRTWVARTVR